MELFESAAHKVAFHGVPFQAVVRCSEPCRVVRDIVVVSVSSSHLLAALPCFRYPFCLVDTAGFNLEMRFVMRPSLAIILARFQYILLSEDTRDSICCQEVVNLVGCSHYVVNPWLQFVSQLVWWHAVEGRFAVSVLVAFFLLVGVLWVGLGRVVLPFTVWVVWSIVSSFFEACAAT